ncbi:20095_t:CDS:2, partial [Funneliformis geosporum]
MRKLIYWGIDDTENVNGRLHGRAENILKFLQSLSNNIIVVTGENHCLSLTKDGEVFSWESGRFGQLGIRELTDLTTMYLLITSKEVNFWMESLWEIGENDEELNVLKVDGGSARTVVITDIIEKVDTIVEVPSAARTPPSLITSTPTNINFIFKTHANVFVEA